MTVLLVLAGAMVGAPLRYLTDRAVQSRHDSLFPWGTLTVNAAASLLLGLLAVGAQLHAVPSSVMAAVGTGLCGALSTYSTFSYETVRLLQGRIRFFAVAHIAASVLVCLGAAGLGAIIAFAAWN